MSAGATRRRAWFPSRSANRRRPTTKARKARLYAANAQVASDKSKVDQYSALPQFKQVTAPFDGTITERKIDIGNLVTAGSTSTTTPLYRMAQTDPLRMFVDVPQSAAEELMKRGVPAEMRATGRRWRACFSGTSPARPNAINPQARTMRVEVDMPNANHALVPGTVRERRVQAAPQGTGRSARRGPDFHCGRPAGGASRHGRQGRVRECDHRPRQRQSWWNSASGVKPGDKLVLNISSQIASGQTVAVNEPAASAAKPLTSRR